MKKSYALALLLSAFAVSSFAQDASAIGARRVAERDAAYARSHPAVVQNITPVVHLVKKHHGRKHHAQRHTAKKMAK